ncbi:MAG: flagellar biosynthesis protein FliQ [Minwuiales bacterium]|nr:flagellar biosynthesis protein FliQ [Minwuiales bacterium]
MGPGEVIDVGREAVWVLLKISAPVMLIALGTGLSISLFQALTQIQEMTLAFVPKIIVIFISLTLLMPFMLATLMTFMESISQRIAGLS